MATTDNKILTGAGVEKLSQLVKDAIAQGGGTEYTTKNGIQITEDDVIQNSFNPYDNWLLNALFNYSVYGQGPIGGAKGSTGVVSAPERTSLSHCQTAFNQGYCGMDLPYYGTITKADAYTAGFRYALAVQDNASPDWDSGYQYPQALQEGQSGAITDPTKYDNGILLRATYSNQPCLVWVNKLPYRLLATIPSKIFYKDNQIGNAGLASASGSDLSTILRNIGTAITDAKALATTETAGRVIPDGTTITIDSNGVISSQGGSSYTFTSGLTENNGTVSWDLNDRIKKGNDGGVSMMYVDSYGSPPTIMITNGGYVIGGTGTSNNRFTARYGGLAGGFTNSSGSQILAYDYGALAYGFTDSSNEKVDAHGIASQAFGQDVIANGRCQMAHGKHNIIDSQSIFAEIVGNGTSSTAKSNASALDWSGNQYLAGSLYVGCTDYTTTSSGLQTANCGGQKVFYGTLTSTDTAPTVEGAINWVYE